MSAAAIPRFIRHAAVTLIKDPPHPYPAPWVALLEHGTHDGAGRFPRAHFHTGEELEGEMVDAGLELVSVCAVEGPSGLAFEDLPEADENLHQAAMTLVRAVGHLPGIRDMSNHMMAIGTVR